ncbi:MFS transporter [Ancylobacter amanitiformis]|uniref:FSR family fosmidomycin resistance protein-like MFS transporter n=1 Tax=Ancylobacter amanitiformis TaxID=217069 RepID=A0ABU0LTF5_9HYPH|nr:MFS transporter [Ancylobacter amanitiformis]MDQ0511959.1 FSR family fosmidomycin resistance protein-like MFS transporter [Ancylobacter amanitiformis]
MSLNASAGTARSAVMPVLVALSVAHFLNDMIQSLIPAAYPIIKEAYALDFSQIGIITLTFQISASLLQPVIGFYTDRRPLPYSMVAGMGFTLVGLIGLAYAGSYPLLLVASACVGIGSSIFHPEATRMARNASGGRHGFAQGLFQVGGQSGAAIGPLLAAFIIVPNGQTSLSWFSTVALLAMPLLAWTAHHHARAMGRMVARGGPHLAADTPGPSLRQAAPALFILILLLTSKTAYIASFTSFYTFYLIERFDVSVQASQLMLFLYLVASATGVLFGGMLGDRIGRNKIIWFSILGALPFTVILPHVGLFWTGVLTVVINLIMSSAFAAILVYAMELLPNRIGLIGGFFYGLVFGLGGLAAAALGVFADHHGIDAVYEVCAFLPAFGLLAWFLPSLREARVS